MAISLKKVPGSFLIPGVTSLVHLYVGYAFFMWIVYREKSLLSKLIWVMLMMVLGNWTAAFGVFFAPNASQGDWRKFWMGVKQPEGF